VNLAARLCAQAGSGQILIDSVVRVAVQALAEIEPAGEFQPRGFSRKVKAFNVVGLRESSDHSASS
jgi:class 3 adenylate cyclase